MGHLQLYHQNKCQIDAKKYYLISTSIIIIQGKYSIVPCTRYPFNPDASIAEPDWELFLRETATMIAQQQSPKRLLEVRARLYELLTHCIPADVIMKVGCHGYNLTTV